MIWHGLLIFVPPIAMLGLAAAVDLRSRRIPNGLTLLIAITGIMQSFTVFATARPLDAAGGFVAGAALGVLLFALGALGGGDVKLLASLGTWLGAAMIAQVFLGAAIVGMVMVLVQCALQGRLFTLFRNSLLVAINLVHLRQVGLAHVSATGQSCRSVSKPLPYAVPVLLATVGLLLLERGLA